MRRRVINSEGEIIGGFRYADGINRLFTLRDGEFTTFDLPGALPVAQDDGGINARGDIVGVTCGASPCDFESPVRHGFVLREGELTMIDISGARVTLVLGINARGSLAGSYDAIGKQQGVPALARTIVARTEAELGLTGQTSSCVFGFCSV